jgi:ABC-type nitrate/sulfonate/bicarbonate transport system ATPase subunit
MPKEKIKVEADKSFGAAHILDNISFSVMENEFLCIVGPSGCGKTVLMQIVAGLISPTHGKLTIDGEKLDCTKHRIGMVFQEPSCLPWLTVWEDIKFGLDINNVDQAEIDKRVTKLLEIVGLTGFENFYPHQISGGMKQRVAIARAFVTQPDLLIMDEPFGHLDAQTRYFMQMEVLRIWQEMKTTVIFVTNNIEEALYVGERVLVLSPVPAKIKAEIIVDLPRPRDITDDTFLKLRKEITDYYEVKL